MILRNELIKFYEAMHIKMGMTVDVPCGISIIEDVDAYLEQLKLNVVSKSLNATYKKGDNVILDTGLKAEILGFYNNLAIVFDERGLKFYKQLHKIKHQ